MILLQTGLALLLCLVAKAEVKRELGFTGLGSYHGGNEGHAASEEFHGSVERQGKIPEFTGGLTNYAANNAGLSRNVGFNHYGSHGYQHSGNLHNNPTVAPNFHSQSNIGPHSTAFDHGWTGRNKFGSLQNGLNVGHSPTLDVSVPKPVIPVREAARPHSPLLTPIRHVPFSGITYPTAVKDYKNGAFISNAHPGLLVPHDASFGLRLLPSRIGHGLFGHGHFSHGNFDSGTRHLLGAFHENQANFGQHTRYFSPNHGLNAYNQHSFVHDAPGFKTGVQGQAVSHIGPNHAPGITHVPGQVGYQPHTHGHSEDGNSQNYGSSFSNTAQTSAESHENFPYSEDHATNDVDPHQGSQFESDGQGNNGNQHSLDYNSSQQDYSNPPVNDHEVGHHSTSSHEVQNDSIGSHDYGDSSQINHSGSAEQKYIPSGDQATSHVHDSGQNSPSLGDKTSSSLITNGHAVGHSESGAKATSFQSFIIHSYRPKRVFARKYVPKPFVSVHNPFINVPASPVHDGH